MDDEKWTLKALCLCACIVHQYCNCNCNCNCNSICYMQIAIQKWCNEVGSL